MTNQFTSTTAIGAIAALIGLTIGGGLSYAAIPNSSTKVISGCYATSNGALRVIDKQAGVTCAAGEQSLEWNQQGLRWRDAWAAATAYAKNDAVSYAGSAWIARKASTGVQPGTDATAWALLAQKGARGPAGLPGVLYYSQQQAQGPLPASFTFTAVPAGHVRIRVEATAYATGQGRGWVSVEA